MAVRNGNNKKTARNKKIEKLQKERDRLWKDFWRMPRRESFSGLHVAGKLDKVQRELDKLEGDKRSKRYRAEINIESF